VRPLLAFLVGAGLGGAHWAGASASRGDDEQECAQAHGAVQPGVSDALAEDDVAPAIVERFAADVVAVMTAMPSPNWRLRADA
jgi:hypothetical protein